MKKQSPHPSWATQHRTKGTELRFLSGKYYLYAVSSKYDPILKRAKKISGRLLGKIDEENGFIESSKDKLRKTVGLPVINDCISTKDFGTQALMLKLGSKQLEALENVFGQDGKALFLFAFFRLTEQSPIKNVLFYYAHSYWSQTWPTAKVSDKEISQLLRRVGENRPKIMEYQKLFFKEEETVLLDMTHVITHSHKLESAQSGYNNSMSFKPQVNLMYLFSAQQHEPIYYRLVPGNIRDVKAFTLSIQECNLKNIMLIADKGFYSKKNVDQLDQPKLPYIIPLQRGSSLIEYPKPNEEANKIWDGYFTFNGTIIWYRTNNFVHLYLNQALKIAEEKDYLTRVEGQKEKYSMDTFYKKQVHFGTLALLSKHNEKTTEQIYTTYKSRTNVETMFDAYKNIIDADTTYMQNEAAMEGWMFVSHIALQMYYNIYEELNQHKILKKYSVTDFLKFTHRIKKIKINEKWFTSEVTKPIKTLLDKLNLDIT
jgi:transposase